MLILSLVGYLLQYLFSIYSYFIFYRNFDSVIAAVVTTVIYYNFQWYLNVYYLKLYLLLEKCYRDYCDIIIFCLFFLKFDQTTRYFLRSWKNWFYRMMCKRNFERSAIWVCNENLSNTFCTFIGKRCCKVQIVKVEKS